MKLINKESNAEYSSPTLEWDEDWRCYRDYAPTLYEFHKEDGWEEVGDEKDFVTKWHDLRKDPDDLPDTSREVLCCVLSERYMEVLRYFSHFKKFVNGSGICCVEVIAWRELPKFGEKSYENKE